MFLPIEPPRTGNPNDETYARRQHEFSQIQLGKQKKSIFSRTSLRETYSEPSRVSLDARLPNPSILTCNEPVPLRLITRKLTDSPDMIYLQMLQIELISHTKILAHGLTQTELNTWVIVSRSNMDLALGKPDDKAGTDWAIDPNLWNAVPLPNSVAPSFETCNIERRYELEIRVGLTHGTPGNMKVLLQSCSFCSHCYSSMAPRVNNPYSRNSLFFHCECQSKSTLASLPLRPSWMPWQQQRNSHQKPSRHIGRLGR